MRDAKKSEVNSLAELLAFRDLLRETKVAIHVAQDGMIKFPNLATLDLYGYSEEQLTSRPFTDFLHPDDQELVSERYNKRILGEELPST